MFQSCPAIHVAPLASFLTESFMAHGTTWGTRSGTAVSQDLSWKDTASSRVLYHLAVEHSGTSHHHFVEVRPYVCAVFFLCLFLCQLFGAPLVPKIDHLSCHTLTDMTSCTGPCPKTQRYSTTPGSEINHWHRTLTRGHMPEEDEKC